MVSNKGDVIERIVRTKIGISELSRILHVSRTSIYNWFEHGHLSLETICKIGHAINHDFSKEFPEEFSERRNHHSTEFISENELNNKHVENPVYYWMNKYILLLEKYNELLTIITNPDTKVSLKNKGSNINDSIQFNRNQYQDQRDHHKMIIP